MFGCKFDKTVIPTGVYCYTIPESELHKVDDIKVNTCPYYRSVNDSEIKGCAYCGVCEKNLLLSDMVKICGEN